MSSATGSTGRAPKARLAKWMAALTVGVVALVASLWAAGAGAQTPISLRVTTSVAGAADVVDFEGKSYADAKAAIVAREAAGTATVPVALTGLSDLVSPSATLSTDDASFGLALRGSTTVLGTPGTLLLTATWDNAADTDPNVAVIVRFGSVGLGVLNPSWNSVPVAFGPALVGLTDTALRQQLLVEAANAKFRLLRTVIVGQ